MPVNAIASPPLASSVSQSSGSWGPPFGGTESIAFRSSSKRPSVWTAWLSRPLMTIAASSATAARARIRAARTGCRAIVAKLLDIVIPPLDEKSADITGREPR